MTPIKEHKRGLTCCTMFPTAPGPREQQKQNSLRRSNSAHAQLFLNPGPWPRPPARSTRHSAAFCTTKLLLRFVLPLSKYRATKSQCFLGAGRTRRIMTFSEIGPGSPKMAMPSTDVSLYNYINQDTTAGEAATARSGLEVLREVYFWGQKLSWGYQVLPVSFCHMDAISTDRVW